MLEGEYGAAAQEAMSILVKIAEAYDAKRMVPAKSAHVAAGLFPEEVEWYERLLQGGAKCRCFTTRHPWGIDYDHFEEVGTVYGNTPEIKEIAEMIFSYSLKMGVIPLGTCIQYLLGDFLMPGDAFSWTGSSGVVCQLRAGCPGKHGRGGDQLLRGHNGQGPGVRHAPG